MACLRCAEFEAKTLGLSEAATEAAGSYDGRHHCRSDATRKELATLHIDETSITHDVAFNVGLNEVRRNRLFMDEVAMPPAYHPTSPPPAKKHARRAKKRVWRLDDSVWVPRLTTGNSKDYFETDASLRRTFDCDWDRTRRGHALDWAIVRASESAEEWKTVDTTGSAAGLPPVEDVRAVLWRCAPLAGGSPPRHGQTNCDARL